MRFSNFPSQTSLPADEVSNWLQKKGKVLCLQPGFNFTGFLGALNHWFDSRNDFEHQFFSLSAAFLIQFRLRSKIQSMLGSEMIFHLLFEKNGDLLFFGIKPGFWAEKSENFSLETPGKRTTIASLPQKDIENKIAALILTQDCRENTRKTQHNRYTQAIEPFLELWLRQHLENDEWLLAALSISPEKNSGLEWKYLLTSHETAIVGFDKQLLARQKKQLENFSLSFEPQENRVFFEKTAVKCDKTTFSRFREIKKAHQSSHAFERLRHIARQNHLKKPRKQTVAPFAEKLLSFLEKNTENTLDRLSLFYVRFADQKDWEKSEKAPELVEILHEILAGEKQGSALLQWIGDWQVPHNRQIALMALIMRLPPEDLAIGVALPFHRALRKEFHKHNKDKIDLTVFDLQFCRHLIETGHKAESIPLLEKLLAEMPDQSLLELLPPKNIDPAGRGGGQVLRIMALDLLLRAKPKSANEAITAQLAVLQPLVKSRIDALLQLKNQWYKEKAQELRPLFEAEALQTSYLTREKGKFKALPKDLIESYLRHPASRGGGAVSKMQSWIAKPDTPDSATLKNFAEEISSKNYPHVIEIITDIRYALQMPPIKVYVGRGSKATGLESHQENNPLIILGEKHLDHNLPHFLNEKELEFALGAEAAHLYFQHTRLSQQDVWKGAKDKSLFVLEALLMLIPAAGTLGKTLHRLGKLTGVAQILQQTQKIEPITTKSKEIFDSASQTVNRYKKKYAKHSKKEAKKRELLLISRLMQLTADRAGLLFCGDLKSAIRAIFLSSPIWFEHFEMAKRYGIHKFLLQKDEDGNFIYQDLTVRIAALFSFFLSADYHRLRANLQAE